MTIALRAMALVAGLGLAACTGDVEPPEEEDPLPEPDLVCDPTAAPSVGRAPLRRLTREQLDHTIRDVLASRETFSESLDADERVGPFASNGVIPVSRTIVEQYQEAAERVAGSLDYAALDDCNRLTTPPRDCARGVVEELGPRLYRRPVTADDIDLLLEVYDEIAVDATHTDGLRVMVGTMLQMPDFLYHVEIGRQGEAVGALVPLAAHELAARLSYFLWNTAPDEALIAAAEAGELETPEGVRAQAERMLADPKAADSIGSFALQWLGVHELSDKSRDSTLYPEFDEEMARAMEQETRRFADYVVREGDGSLDTLLTADFSFPSGPLFDLYGVAEPAGYDGSAPVSLDPSQRAGILTHASVMTEHAHNQVSSLTLRGKMIRENVFCELLPPPPPDVVLEIPEVAPGATTRERFSAHVENQVCASCHRFIDDIGFGFENYDAIGGYRTEDNGLPVDARGNIDGTDVEGEFVGAVELAQVLASSQQVERCVATQWFRYGLGRWETDADACSVTPLYDAMERPDDLRAVILAVVTSDAFRHVTVWE